MQSTVPGDATPIATYVSENSGATATVVFIHGFTLAADSYFQQVQYLRSEFPQVRCLLLDLRGHGATGESDPDSCTVDGAADDVVTAIRAHAPDGPIFLVGHSLGGLVALSLIRRADEALYRRISGLILIATSIESLTTQGLPQVLASPLADRAYYVLESSPEKVSKFRNDMADLLAPALAATVFKRHATPYDLVKFHADMIQKTPLSTFAGYFDDLQHHEETACAPRLQGMPGFVIVGEDDHVTPLSQSNHIIDRWPDATLVKTKGVGHMIILEAPELVNQALAELLNQTPLNSD
ncbi:alpha/beta hydrolase [Staphylococcus chromogenes]|nr:alpha/beta hydrolase [Staphylococcus chromogenes]